jgi:hypothetical protein
VIGALNKVFCHHSNPTSPNKLIAMKAKTIRPHKRHFLALLPLLMVSGCSGIQPDSVYKSWEQQAYRAYNLSAPPVKPGILPALLRTVSVPGQQFLRHHPTQRVSYPPAGTGSEPVRIPDRIDERELDFIEQNYGI